MGREVRMSKMMMSVCIVERLGMSGKIILHGWALGIEPGVSSTLPLWQLYRLVVQKGMDGTTKAYTNTHTDFYE